MKIKRVFFTKEYKSVVSEKHHSDAIPHLAKGSSCLNTDNNIPLNRSATCGSK
ncbi:hypothetical protein [Kosakonia oryzae]|uniref:hypothetical protein n=1 Tax=Kosakonia oryzae TaxID=497725 RepID=UPI001D0982CF|nr:hypothetical protein [Kosakonia oryzae]UDJ82065.1 hypothetical protein I5186_23525 [Kosakonia oryzae]